MKKLTLTLGSIMIAVLMILNQSCDKKTAVEPAASVEIEFSYGPNPATVNTEISFEFEAVEAGAAHDDGGEEHHFELSMIECEIGLSSGTTHDEMTVTHNELEEHYEGTWTFTEAGTYDVHFSYMYEGVMGEKEFEIVIVAQ